MDQPFNIQEMQQRCLRFMHERNWDRFNTVRNLAMALSVETSELMEIVQWMTDLDTLSLPQDPQKMALIKDEIGDIFHVLLRLCLLLNIDLGQAFWDKIHKTEAKYPPALCHGKPDKYTAYE